MDEDDVGRAVRLSLLGREGRTKETFAREVQGILSFVDDVRTIETGGATERGKKNVLRDDTVTVSEGGHREMFLGQAPSRFKNWLVSKKII